VQAAALMDGPVEVVSIPYDKQELPAYLFLVDKSGKPRPTIIYTNGFDSTREEAYFAIGAAALRRGYNVLAYDGPGQGTPIREQGLTFRHDWEAVLGPVMDYAFTRPEVIRRIDRIPPHQHSPGHVHHARAADDASSDPRLRLTPRRTVASATTPGGTRRGSRCSSVRHAASPYRVRSGFLHRRGFSIPEQLRSLVPTRNEGIRQGPPTTRTVPRRLFPDLLDPSGPRPY
jgi:hypothetical protein